jgi:class 3 adenylate cyclase
MMLNSFGIERKLNLSWLLSNSWRLRFPLEQEKLFREDHYRKTIVLARLALGLGIILNLLFTFLDAQTLAVSKDGVWFIRYLIALPLSLVCLVAICLPSLKKLYQFFLSLAMLTGTLFVLGIIAISHPEEPGYSLYQSLLLLVILTTYTFLQLRFVYAVVLGWLNLGLYLGIALFYQNLLASERGMTLFLSNIFFFVTGNILGMFACYSLELYLRRDFVQRQIIQQEQAKADRLLLNVLPEKVANQLKERPGTIAEHYDNVTILFADIVNFTPLSAQLEPAQLVELLNQLFSHFDTLVDKYGLEKIKTIGDCYMVAAGVPIHRADHALVMAQLALEMQRYVEEQTFMGDRRLELRIGLNSGPVVAGIIGHKKFSYDLWGDTVNTASRMESHGSKGKIQLTRSTYELIKDEYECTTAGTLPIKGKGELEVWHLVGQTIAPQISANSFEPKALFQLI